MRKALLVAVTFSLLSCTNRRRPDAPSETSKGIAALPRVDFAQQCYDSDTGVRCDYSVEDSVFSTLERVIPRAVRIGQSYAEARARLGSAPTSYGPVERWERITDRAQVERWTYARTLSGTGGFFVYFVADRVAFVGRASQSWGDAQFGRQR